MNDFELLQAVEFGCKHSFSQLYDRHAPYVLGAMLQCGLGRGHCETLLVDLFHDVWQLKERYEATRCSPRLWLCLLGRRRATMVTSPPMFETAQPELILA